MDSHKVTGKLQTTIPKKILFPNKETGIFVEIFNEGQKIQRSVFRGSRRVSRQP